MSKSKLKIIFIVGVCCLLFLLVSVWYTYTFNAGRLVKPMDFSAYVFQIKDIPMLAAISAIILYGFFLAFLLFISLLNQRHNKTKAKKTRKLNPKLGLLGFLGFFGFLGFWTYSINKTVFPFCFFVFFGFFGFFFEGKMSDTLMDERFKENAQKAQLTAYKIGFALIWLLLLLIGQGRFAANLEHAVIVLIAAISFILGFTLFLGKYLLYRYDHDGQSEEEINGGI